jgi:hypothetical protein
MLGAPGRNRKIVRAHRIAVFKKIVIATCASLFDALRMQQASWLVISGPAPWLFPGMYPSGIAHVVCPIDSIKTRARKQIDVRFGNGLHNSLRPRRILGRLTASRNQLTSMLFQSAVQRPRCEKFNSAAHDFLRRQKYRGADKSPGNLVGIT